MDDSWLDNHAALKLPCGVFVNGTTTTTTAVTTTTTATATTTTRELAATTTTTTNCVTNYAHIFTSFSLWLCKKSAWGQSNSGSEGRGAGTGAGKGVSE